MLDLGSAVDSGQSQGMDSILGNYLSYKGAESLIKGKYGQKVVGKLGEAIGKNPAAMKTLGTNIAKYARAATVGLFIAKLGIDFGEGLVQAERKKSQQRSRVAGLDLQLAMSGISRERRDSIKNSAKDAAVTLWTTDWFNVAFRQGALAENEKLVADEVENQAKLVKMREQAWQAQGNSIAAAVQNKELELNRKLYPHEVSGLLEAEVQSKFQPTEAQIDSQYMDQVAAMGFYEKIGHKLASKADSMVEFRAKQQIKTKLQSKIARDTVSQAQKREEMGQRYMAERSPAEAFKISEEQRVVSGMINTILYRHKVQRLD